MIGTTNLTFSEQDMIQKIVQNQFKYVEAENQQLEKLTKLLQAQELAQYRLKRQYEEKLERKERKMKKKKKKEMKKKKQKKQKREKKKVVEPQTDNVERSLVQPPAPEILVEEADVPSVRQTRKQKRIPGKKPGDVGGPKNVPQTDGFNTWSSSNSSEEDNDSDYNPSSDASSDTSDSKDDSSSSSSTSSSSSSSSDDQEPFLSARETLPKDSDDVEPQPGPSHEEKTKEKVAEKIKPNSDNEKRKKKEKRRNEAKKERKKEKKRERHCRKKLKRCLKSELRNKDGPLNYLANLSKEISEVKSKSGKDSQSCSSTINNFFRTTVGQNLGEAPDEKVAWVEEFALDIAGNRCDQLTIKSTRDICVEEYTRFQGIDIIELK